MKIKIERLQLILKTVERCNIACTYCYYFYGGDESYKKRPPVISKTTIDKTVNFILDSISEIEIDEIQIVFHGGEPLLQKKRDFDYACIEFSRELSGLVKLNFCVQTNGMLIDEEWISLFSKHDVAVGISLDGNKIINDKNRIDHKGRGTYERVINGLNMALEARKKGDLLQNPGVLTVVNHESNYSKIVEHFAHDLGVTEIGVLLPDMSHDNFFPDGATSIDYGNVLIELFDIAMKNEKIKIRSASKVLDFFQLKEMSGIGTEKASILSEFIKQGGRYIKNQIIVIQSDGEISLDDSFIPALKWRMSQGTYSIEDITLYKYLSLPVFDEISDSYSNLPKKCSECTWVKLCGGGDLENRYKSGNGFNQPSVFCEGLQAYYEHVVTYLYKNGYPKEILLEKLTG
jgi:uncharacterized protein